MAGYITPIELQAARLSDSIYHRDNRFTEAKYYRTLIQRGTFDNVITNRGSFTGLRQIDDVLYVVYRGTANARDVMTDIEPGKSPTHFGKVRKGFYKYARRTWRPIRRHIRLTRPRSIVFCGHSLGGAAALVGAILCYTAFEFLQNSTHVVTFGAPRTLSGEAALNIHEEFDNRVSSFIRAGDPVSSVPPLIFFLRHPHEVIYFKPGKMVRNIESGLIARFFKSWWQAVRGALAFGGTHSMQKNYLDILDGLEVHESNTESISAGIVSFNDLEEPVNGF